MINWFTVGAQAVNFLVLVWLLKRFLYKPILHAIDEREKGIAARLAAAEADVAAAKTAGEAYEQKTAEFDRERAALLTKATDEAKAAAQQLLAEARKDADALRAKRQEALRVEQHDMTQALTLWTQREVFAVARKTLADLAGADLEESMGKEFIRRLRALTGTAKEQLASALKAPPAVAVIRSAVDLPAAQRAAIEGAVKDVLDAKANVQFQVAPELVGGIELAAGGQKVAWSIAGYLTPLEKSVDELVQ